MSLVMKRRSIRKYTNQKIDREILALLVRSGMQAPSAGNQQPWEFIIVDDRKILDTLSETSKGAWMLKKAQAAIIPMLKESDYAPMFSAQDCAAATQNILLESVHQGLGAVWIGIYPLEERIGHVSRTLNITGNAVPFAIISLGYPDDDREIVSRYDESLIHYNEWKK